ncbi:sensor histidine kinase [Patiriisocius hiemis]|uniref:Oxygen sensor histidine kinase NreB n=1 Tax=Patiriisocius hiemis TaxID=3075604 RepID=A0ABU2YF06_9FLAO|nr:sensor histidine kinase [Constantimarinum sp. W242]MDT0556775.1 sensor histidine kinase [Constantimarinum sp. W242]
MSISVYAQEDSLLIQLKKLNNKELFTQAVSLWEKNEINNPSGSLLLTVGTSYENINNEDKALFFYEKALQYFKKTDETEYLAETYFKIYSLLDSQKNLLTTTTNYFDNFLKYAKESDKSEWKAEMNNQLAIKDFNNNDPKIPYNYFNKALQHFKTLKDTNRIAGTYSNIGLLFLNNFKKPDSSRFYLNKALDISQTTQNINTQWNVLLNIGNTYKFQENYNTAIKYYLKADSLPIKKYSLNKKRLLYYHLQDSYRELGDFKNSDNYLLDYIEIKDSINLLEQNKTISEINTKYQTAEKEKQLLISNQEKKQNRNIAIGLAGSLAAVSIIAFLVFKNTRRKQFIAEQEREIEIQKTEKILKEQELTTIDAMIAGQEKERQRLASDLHDSVGATLAAAKMQFDHLAQNKAKAAQLDEVFAKTGKLLDDAYTEVRSMAHIKNSGVIAKNGLLPAVEKLAKNASGVNNLSIEVQHFGLENRIENSLEISIFRIIQELVTNIIKHSKATEASISITQHEDSINIIVEDNGVGFNSKHLNFNEGMGLSSIEKRIEHLEGSFEVDATKGKGTTILIDIPL